MDIVICLPASIKWEEYKKELSAAEKGDILNFKVSNFPIKANIGDKCYIVHLGIVKGFMHISGFSKGDFNCSVTGDQWKGKFIQRTGKFYSIEDKNIKIKPFQGFRYCNF